MKPWRSGVRALLLDPADRVLLVHFDFDPFPWALPGGGREPDEADEAALRRELAEEVGLDAFELGPCLWEREHAFDFESTWFGQRERVYLVRVPVFEPQPRIDLAAEHVDDVRWWTPDEIAGADAVFAPRAFGELFAQLLEHGPPAVPWQLGK